MITWTLALYLTKYVDKSDYKYVVESLLFHEKSLTPYVKFMEITGVCRVYLPSDFENVNKEVSVEASHPLTHSQRRYILDYININNIPSDKIYVDDYSKEQCIKNFLFMNHSLLKLRRAGTTKSNKIEICCRFHLVAKISRCKLTQCVCL